MVWILFRPLWALAQLNTFLALRWYQIGSPNPSNSQHQLPWREDLGSFHAALKKKAIWNEVCCHNSLIYRQHAWHVEKKGIYGALLSIIKGYIYFSTAGMYCGQGIVYCKLGQLGLFFGSFFWLVYHSSPHFLDGYRMVLLLICQVSSIMFLSFQTCFCLFCSSFFVPIRTSLLIFIGIWWHRISK